MANHVSWFEVVGQDGEKLRSFYGDVFGWSFNMPAPEMNYGMTDPSESGIGGGIRQAQGGAGHAQVYVRVPPPPGRAPAAASARPRAGPGTPRSTSAFPIRRRRWTRSRGRAARPSCR